MGTLGTAWYLCWSIGSSRRERCFGFESQDRISQPTIPCHLWGQFFHSATPLKRDYPPNWADLVWYSSEKTTSKFYNLTLIWFDGQSDETVNETLTPPPTSSWPKLCIDSTDNTVPTSNEGAESMVSKGDLESPISQAHKGESGMPPITDLKTAGFWRCPCLQEQREKQRLRFTSILMKICAFGIVMASCLQPTYTLSTGQAVVNSFIHQCKVMNVNFDGFFNAIPHMIFAAGKEINECYTFKEILTQPDHWKFLEAMLKETAKQKFQKHLFCACWCQRIPNQFRPFGLLNRSNIPTDLSISIKPTSVHIEVCSTGELITWRPMHQWWIGSASTFYWFCLKSLDWRPKQSTLF